MVSQREDAYVCNLASPKPIWPPNPQDVPQNYRSRQSTFGNAAESQSLLLSPD